MELSDLAYIDDTGYHFADYPTYLEYFTNKYKAIYGDDVYLEPDSQDAQNIAVQAKAAYDSAALGASTYNSFSPATAQGVGLSRNVKINGINRRIATNSTVDLTITGVAGTVINNGVAQDTLDQKWDLPAIVTIGGGGTVVITATAQEVGAISALPGTVTGIFTPTRGWQSVTNISAASLGAPVETDAELRLRQAESTANPSLTVFEGTVGSVANVEGVTAVKGYENDTDSTDANGITEHSICIVVSGGDAEEIAQTIALHKTPGTGTFGDTTETVYDSRGMPIIIKFERPTPVPIAVEITISAGVGWSTDFEAFIQEAVAAKVLEFGIGGTILISKLYAPAYLIGTDNAADGSTYDITSIEIGRDGDPVSDVNIELDFDEIPTCDLVDITFVVT